MHVVQDLLDPEGWEHGDRAVVLAAAARQGQARATALQLRFGSPPGTPPPSAAEVADRLGWSARKTRDTISQFLHAIPPPAEHAPLEVLYEDASLVAVNKPAGLPCTPAHRLATHLCIYVHTWLLPHACVYFRMRAYTRQWRYSL